MLRQGRSLCKSDTIDFVARVDISDIDKLLSEVSGKGKLQL